MDNSAELRFSFTDLVGNYEGAFYAVVLQQDEQPVIIMDDLESVTGQTLQFHDWFSLETILHPDDRTFLKDFTQNRHQPGHNSISIRINTANGQYIPVNINTFLFPSGKTTPELVIFSRKTGPDREPESPGHRQLLENMNDIIFQTDAGGSWIYLNRSWSRIMGYEIDESLGKSVLNFLHPDDVGKNFRSSAQLNSGEASEVNYEVRYISKTGEIVWLNVYSVLMRDAGGNITGTTGTLRDVSQDRLNRDMIELLSNNIEDLVCVHDADGNYQYVSPSSKATTGYLPEELLGRSLYSFIHPDDANHFGNESFTLLDLERNSELYATIRFRQKNGSYKWFETIAKVIKDENDMPIGLVTSSRVIDQRKNAEEQLLKSLHKEQELNQMKSSFVSLASHEFRTPLACIRTSVELLEISASKAKEPLTGLEKHIKNVFSEVDRLTVLIDEFLTLGRIESEGLRCKKEKVKITDIIKSVIGNLEDGRKISLVVEGKPRIVMVDPLLITHALSNLISNALKYSPGRPDPVVTLQFAKSGFIVKVRDFGIGIPASEHGKIFEAFHRASNAQSLPGTGLGMFITRNFIELHGGRVNFESTMNHGSEFTIELP